MDEPLQDTQKELRELRCRKIAMEIVTKEGMKNGRMSSAVLLEAAGTLNGIIVAVPMRSDTLWNLKQKGIAGAIIDRRKLKMRVDAMFKVCGWLHSNASGRNESSVFLFASEETLCGFIGPDGRARLLWTQVEPHEYEWYAPPAWRGQPLLLDREEAERVMLA